MSFLMRNHMAKPCGIPCKMNLVVYNPRASRADRVDPQAVGKRYFKGEFAVIAPQQLGCYLPPREVVAIGGDGTLQSVLAWCGDSPTLVRYLPLGTLNERSEGQEGRPILGRASGGVFTYVLATGIFCPLGWAAPAGAKRKWHRLAYLVRVPKEYRVQDFPMRVVADGERYEGRYTLAMLIRSPVCFGLPFNHAYRPDEAGGHLLLVPTTGRDNLLNRIRLFGPLFRIFFVGLGEDKVCSRYVWRRVECVEIEAPLLEWCADGERWEMGSTEVFWRPAEARVKVLPKIDY